MGMALYCKEICASARIYHDLGRRAGWMVSGRFGMMKGDARAEVGL